MFVEDVVEVGMVQLAKMVKSVPFIWIVLTVVGRNVRVEFIVCCIPMFTSQRVCGCSILMMPDSSRDCVSQDRETCPVFNTCFCLFYFFYRSI